MKLRNLTLLFIMIATLSARSQKEDGDTTIYQFKVRAWMEKNLILVLLKVKK